METQRGDLLPLPIKALTTNPRGYAPGSFLDFIVFEMI